MTEDFKQEGERLLANLDKHFLGDVKEHGFWWAHCCTYLDAAIRLGATEAAEWFGGRLEEYTIDPYAGMDP